MADSTFIIANDGTRLMPTFNIKKVRKWLKSGKARIVGYEPFTVQLLFNTTHYTQPIEACEDTGDRHIGFSIKSEKHEFVSAQYDQLKDETERHDDCRKYRKARRHRKKYRKRRFDNRKRKTIYEDDKWLAPSVKNKELNHLRILEKYAKVCPITDVHLECGSFDTQALEAIEAGKPLPQGEDYQHGPRYGYDTLREAVFARDNYTCICCGSTIGKRKTKDGKYVKAKVILRLHHLGFKTGDHTNRMSNLGTVCIRCHTPAAHKPGGKLYNLNPKLRPFKGASFMTSMRFQLVRDVKRAMPDANVHMCYGAATKRERLTRNLEKSHANDAYCIGQYRPKHRSKTEYWKKRRRNKRILEKFYDAKFIDTRDGETKKAAELPSLCTNRSQPRYNMYYPKRFRGKKVSKGRRTIRKRRYPLQSGDVVLYNDKRYTSTGCQNYGEYVTLEGVEKAPKVSEVKVLYHAGGWIRTA